MRVTYLRHRSQTVRLRYQSGSLRCSDDSYFRDLNPGGITLPTPEQVSDPCSLFYFVCQDDPGPAADGAAKDLARRVLAAGLRYGDRNNPPGSPEPPDYSGIDQLKLASIDPSLHPGAADWWVFGNGTSFDGAATSTTSDPSNVDEVSGNVFKTHTEMRETTYTCTKAGWAGCPATGTW
jgi:hypothetical protein